MPLGYLSKTNRADDQNILRDFDTCDEAGHSVSVLGRYDNTLVTWSVLVVAANRAAGGDGDEPLNPLEEALLWAVAASPAHQARWVVRELLELAPAADAYCPTLYRGRQGSGRHAFAYLLDRLSTDYMLLVDLRASSGVERRVVKYAYDTGWPRPRGRPYNLAWWFGITATPVMLELGSPLPGRSYHFEFHAPDGLEFVSAELFATSPLSGRRSWRAAQDARIRSHRTVAHVYMERIRPGERLAAVVAVKPVPSSGLVLSVVGGGLLAAGLFAGSLQPQTIVQSESAVITLLVLLPGILTGSLLARLSHDVIGLLFGGLRWLTGAILIVSVVAVGSLVATAVFDVHAPPGRILLPDYAERLKWVWRGLSVVAAAVTLILLPSLRPYGWWRRWDWPGRDPAVLVGQWWRGAYGGRRQGRRQRQAHEHTTV